jgi:hypothetical protein
MTTTLEEANETLRNAVRTRLDATPADDPKMLGYVSQPETEPRDIGASTEEMQDVVFRYDAEAMKKFAAMLNEATGEEAARLCGDGLIKPDVHPTSQAFFDLCDALKEMHRRKSRDYGCPSGEDPLANIRNGAKFVGIPSWKGAMVRLSDKVTRLASYNATGRLENESLEDNLFDLASYSLLALLLHREERDA